MDKSFIEERLKQRASRRLTDEKNRATKELSNNRVLDRLKIKIGEKEYFLYQFITQDSCKQFSNIEKVLADIKDEYYQQESDGLLNSLDSIKSYLESQGDY